jgi:hypothetical protein
MYLLGIIILLRIHFAASSANDSYCIDYTNFTFVSPLTVVPYENVQRRYGNVDCLTGDIVLVGKYINLGNVIDANLLICELHRPLIVRNYFMKVSLIAGIHNVGSFGTRAIVKAADGLYVDRLGFISDYNRTGWAKGYAGDFFVPDSPIEGFDCSNITMQTYTGFMLHPSSSIRMYKIDLPYFVSDCHSIH